MTKSEMLNIIGKLTTHTAGVIHRAYEADAREEVKGGWKWSPTVAHANVLALAEREGAYEPQDETTVDAFLTDAQHESWFKRDPLLGCAKVARKIMRSSAKEAYLARKAEAPAKPKAKRGGKTPAKAAKGMDADAKLAALLELFAKATEILRA